jgi:hypothetical protein
MGVDMRILHCWKGKRDHIDETGGWGTDEYWATYEDGGDGTCMLSAGHPEPHDFTPDEQIGITFERLN